MRKFIPIFGFFILFLLVFTSAAYARQRDYRPGDIAINNAIAWAQSFVLQPAFPVTGANGLTSRSSFKCTDFVANAYGYPATSFTAGLIWYASVVQHPGDWNAPRGSLVFFSPNSYNSRMGHVALSTGNGNLIEAGYDVIIRSTLRDENHNAPYLGWAWPPLTWPGRSDVRKATAFTWAIQAGKALILTILFWLLYLIIRSTISRIKQALAGRALIEKGNRA